MAKAKIPGIRVIVLDDDAMLREMLVSALSEYGYPSTGVADPACAEEAVDIYGAQIVLCDICMPSVNGIEVTRRLKSRHGGTQVILMTGYPNQETVREAFQLGADGYLVKPFRDLRVIFEAIDRAAERLERWEAAMREAIYREFPREYETIYANAASPEPQEIDSLLAEISESSGESAAS